MGPIGRSLSFDPPYPSIQVDQESHLMPLDLDRIARMIEDDIDNTRGSPRLYPPCAFLFGYGLRRSSFDEVVGSICSQDQVIEIVICRRACRIFRHVGIAPYKSLTGNRWLVRMTPSENTARQH